MTYPSVMNLVYDRTWDDVAELKRIKEKILQRGYISLTGAEINTYFAAKGAYNVEDINRVILAMDYLYNLYSHRGYKVERKSVPSTPWTRTLGVRKTNVENYLSNAKALSGAITMYDSSPTLPENMEKLTIEGANAIEKILVEVYELLYNSENIINFSSTLGMSETGLYFGGV